MPAPIKVTKPGSAGPDTLRAAINQANAQATSSTIEFDLPAAATVIAPVGQPGAAVNTLGRNGDDGVTVATGQDNSVVNNSIVDNIDEAIDLADDGPTANDGLLDPDAGRIVATRNVTTDANGLAEGSIDLDPAVLTDKLAMTATVTDPNGVVLGASSELSPCA